MAGTEAVQKGHLRKGTSVPKLPVQTAFDVMAELRS